MSKNFTNVYLACTTSGCKLNSTLLNLSLINEKKNLYVEFNINIASLMTDPNTRNLIEKQMFNNVECYKYFNMDLNTVFIKNQDNIILKEMEDYVKEISDNGNIKLQFWVNNPIDWIFFINKAFIFQGELPIIPEDIIPYPNDINSLIQTITQNNEEGIKSAEDIIPYPKDYEYNSLINAKYNQELSKFLIDNKNTYH